MVLKTLNKSAYKSYYSVVSSSVLSLLVLQTPVYLRDLNRFRVNICVEVYIAIESGILAVTGPDTLRFLKGDARNLLVA